MCHLVPSSALSVSPAAVAALSVSKQNIRAEIIFGVPGRSCEGVGICKILSIDNVYVKWKCPSARATLAMTPGGRLQMIFERARMSTECYERYFQTGIFHIEEAYGLPAELTMALGSDNYLIKEGEYVVEVSENFLKLLL